MRKIKNYLRKKFGDAVTFDMHEIRINGSLRGCSGFVTNQVNGITVYINTETPCMASCSWLHRYAKDNKDFRGCFNKFARTEQQMLDEVCEMLRNEQAYERECRSGR